MHNLRQIEKLAEVEGEGRLLVFHIFKLFWWHEESKAFCGISIKHIWQRKTFHLKIHIYLHSFRSLEIAKTNRQSIHNSLGRSNWIFAKLDMLQCPHFWAQQNSSTKLEFFELFQLFNIDKSAYMFLFAFSMGIVIEIQARLVFVAHHFVDERWKELYI